MNPSQPSQELSMALGALSRDLSKLSANLMVIDHTVQTECAQLKLRLHYPSFRHSKPMISELIDVVSIHIINFCLPRKQVDELHKLYGQVPVEEFTQKLEVTRQEAFDLFKRAHVATNRNGEAGELILYLLTEWILEAPQIIAKMSLKTNSAMPVHGADGVHVRYCATTERLLVYWGEAKLYKDVGQAISEAAKSIAESLTDEKVKHEIGLVKRYLDISGLSDLGKKAMLEMLDPFGSGYANRQDIVSCLIAFDFDAFDAVQAKQSDAEKSFRELAVAKLKDVAPQIATALKSKGLAHQSIELFAIPVPSVERLRDLFQDKIGWKNEAQATSKPAKAVKSAKSKTK